jgi:hypothetical protein
MKTRLWSAAAAGLALLASGSPAVAQVPPVVAFEEIDDAVAPFRFGFLFYGYFSAARTAPDPSNPNTLVLGLDNFRAGGSGISRALSVAHDTISFRVTAPDGYAIRSLTYTQSGQGTVSRLGSVSTSTSWVVDGDAVNVGRRLTTGAYTFSRTVDLAGQGRTSVPVSVTTSLTAVTTGTIGSSACAITSARVAVRLEPLP